MSITINIEYLSISALLNSIGMQAIVEKHLERHPGLMPEEARPLITEDSDYEYVQQVLDSCSRVLTLFQGYSEKERLVQLPARVIYRVFTSSVLLLKTLSIGVKQAQFETALEVLTGSIRSLLSNNLDELHCVPRYAALLDIQLKHLRRYFADSLKYSRSVHTRSSDINSSNTSVREAVTDIHVPGSNALWLEDPSLQWTDMTPDNWLRLPFEPSMAPFDLTGAQAFTGLDLNGLDFMWNISEQ